jgi:cytochrome c-type biogenesis protein CcmH
MIPASLRAKRSNLHWPWPRWRPGVPRSDGFILALALVVLAFLTSPAQAVRPDERLADPALETRAREISKELRCLVCRNQSVDDSDADLAHDLRMLVRERLKAGDSDGGVVAFVRARYGDFVLLRPPFKLDTWLLWGGPLAILLLGGWGLRRYLRRQSQVAAAPALSPDEQRRLARILGPHPLDGGAER